MPHTSLLRVFRIWLRDSGTKGIRSRSHLTAEATLSMSVSRRGLQGLTVGASIFSITQYQSWRKASKTLGMRGADALPWARVKKKCWVLASARTSTPCLINQVGFPGRWKSKKRVAPGFGRLLKWLLRSDWVSSFGKVCRISDRNTKK